MADNRFVDNSDRSVRNTNLMNMMNAYMLGQEKSGRFQHLPARRKPSISYDVKTKEFIEMSAMTYALELLGRAALDCGELKIASQIVMRVIPRDCGGEESFLLEEADEAAVTSGIKVAPTLLGHVTPGIADVATKLAQMESLPYVDRLFFASVALTGSSASDLRSHIRTWAQTAACVTPITEEDVNESDLEITVLRRRLLRAAAAGSDDVANAALSWKHPSWCADGLYPLFSKTQYKASGSFATLQRMTVPISERLENLAASEPVSELNLAPQFALALCQVGVGGSLLFSFVFTPKIDFLCSS